MKLSYKKTDSYLKMIQGKIVQEALFLSNQKNEYFRTNRQILDYLDTRFNLYCHNAHNKCVKKYQNINNHLIREGIHFLQSLQPLNIKTPSAVKFMESYVFPDFFFQKLRFKNKVYRNCIIELKITSNLKKSKLSRDLSQLNKYYKRNHNLFLLYLVINKPNRQKNVSISSKIIKLKKSEKLK